MKKSVKQKNLEKEIMHKLDGKSLEIAKYVFEDEEIQTIHDYANVVSIKRLGFNDHGPVHMRKTALNSLTMFGLLAENKIRFSLETEGMGTLEDSKIAVLIASILHDIGMTITRADHEFLSVALASPIIDRILNEFYQDIIPQRYILKSIILEGIFGHMASKQIHSLEAGLVLIGDGCDMEKGRSRIPILLSNGAKVGDIHKYSANSIEKVFILAGKSKPIRIEVKMNSNVGFFQVEEVLYPKINSSSIKNYIELYAGVIDEDLKKYL